MEPQTNSTNKSFAIASLILGILALASFCTIILPFVFGGLSILFAILSHRKGRQLPSMSLGGILTSASGIAISAMMIVMYLMMLPKLLSDEAYMAQLNSMYETLYGQSLEEMVEENYDISLEEFFGIE